MGKLRVESFAVSIDGFGAGPEQSDALIGQVDGVTKASVWARADTSRIVIMKASPLGANNT